MPKEEEIKKQAIDLIEAYLGSYAASLYENFYKTKSTNEVLTSCKELLSELIGEASANKEIENLKKQL
ncbi:hypothetical protein KKC94_01690 [Patescibacteria group bacterium]|nr:hypothetical protein [Patescibacteria group bacterium]